MSDRIAVCKICTTFFLDGGDTNCPGCGEMAAFSRPNQEEIEALRAHFAREYRESLGSIEGCTPGPWKWHGGNLLDTESPIEEMWDFVVQVCDEGLVISDADRALIESAPDMAAELKKLREEIDKRSTRDHRPDSPLANVGAFCDMCWDAYGDDINGMWNEISERRADCDKYGNDIEDLEKSNAELSAALKFFADNTEICHKHEPGDACVACILEKTIANAERLGKC